MSEWQPIETAPKDRTDIMIGAWHNGVWQQCMSFYMPEYKLFNGKLEQTPTHWMPLPDPPTKEGE